MDKSTYRIYLYDNNERNRSNNNEYGYWAGKCYVHQGISYPVAAGRDSGLPAKEYTSMQRAISGADKVFLRCEEVCGYDIEDADGNIVWRDGDSNRIQ